MQDIFKFLSAYNDQVGDSMDINELAIIYEISWDDVTHANCTTICVYQSKTISL